MAALLHYLLLLMPFAVLAQYGGVGVGPDLAGTEFPITDGFGAAVGGGGGGGGGGGIGGVGGVGGQGGPGQGGQGGHVGQGTGGMGPDAGAGGNAAGFDYYTDHPNYPGGSANIDNYGPGRQAGGATGQPGVTGMGVDDSDEEGSGSSELNGYGSEGPAWAGGGGLGLLKSSSSRWTVTVLSCLLAVAVIALVAFFIIKRRRGSSGVAENP